MSLSNESNGNVPNGPKEIRKIAYTFVIADLLHFGHLQLLKAASEAADYHICGVLTDAAVSEFKNAPISNFEERLAVVSSIRFVDRVEAQHHQDPTENLRRISVEFPEAELVFIYGSNWEETPGGSFLRSVRATLKKQDFYDRLSSDQIAIKTVEALLPSAAFFDTFTHAFVTKDFYTFRAEHSRFSISTKAKTLLQLKPLLRHSLIEPSFVFTVRDWRDYRRKILYEIKRQFRTATIVVRSSCLMEDSLSSAQAGRFHSELNVAASEEVALEQAITKVIDSYQGSHSELGLDQVLIQRQTKQIQMSGVVFSLDLETSAPYYIVNYDLSERSDVVTGGRGGHLVKLFRETEVDELEQPLKDVLIAVQELEKIIPDLPLDIEFAVTQNGQVVLFQVRPMTTNRLPSSGEVKNIGREIRRAQKNWWSLRSKHLPSTTALSDMLLWNPAELIGNQPTPLAYDLFDRLIMSSAWNKGLECLGYPNLDANGLMARLGYKPYIRVDLAFQALIPKVVGIEIRGRLMTYFLYKLKAHPELHDKAEFKIMTSCYDFNLPHRLRELGNHGFSSEERSLLVDQLLGFTKELIHKSQALYISQLALIRQLEVFQQVPLSDRINEAKESPRIMRLMLSVCEKFGTIPFATAARMAFIAETLLRSLVLEGVLSESERLAILNSFSTVAGELTRALAAVSCGQLEPRQFMSRYGHLRSGTYDLRRPRYDAMGFDENSAVHFLPKTPEPLALEIADRLDRYLRNSRLAISFVEFYQFIQTFVSAREHFKLVYTRTISDFLEITTALGNSRGMDSQLLAFMRLKEVLQPLKDQPDIEEKLKKRRSQSLVERKLLLPPIVWENDDLHMLYYFQIVPNYITQKRVSGAVLELGLNEYEGSLHGKIIFIEHADPGYHWLFSKGIAGLVTKYGGVASHMAICCAEMGIPAAIGCGERYDQLKHSRRLSLDCLGHMLREEA